MAEPDDSGKQEERVVAIFPDEAAAERAAERARGYGAVDVAVNDPDDEVRSLVGEMREETSAPDLARPDL